MESLFVLMTELPKDKGARMHLELYQTFLLLTMFLRCTLAPDEKEEPVDVPLAKLGTKYRLIGKLRQPVGTVVTVQGVVVNGPAKGYGHGPNLRVERINGQALQEDIQIKVEPYFNKFGDANGVPEALPKLEFGQTYEFEGFESGMFVGTPPEAYKRAGIMVYNPGFYFMHMLIVYRGKKIGPNRWSPADFVNRQALIEGRAENEGGMAYIQGDGWKLLVDPKTPWAKPHLGKTVEGNGVIVWTNQSATYRLEKGATRLVRLEDQVGLSVALRGTARSKNGAWWLEYRGTDLYVEGMAELSKWSDELVGKPVLVSGVLDEAMLPALDQLGIEPFNERKLKRYYVVRKPSWKPIDALLSPERLEANGK